jgi:hypothetical protein
LIDDQIRRDGNKTNEHERNSVSKYALQQTNKQNQKKSCQQCSSPHPHPHPQQLHIQIQTNLISHGDSLCEGGVVCWLLGWLFFSSNTAPSDSGLVQVKPVSTNVTRGKLILRVMLHIFDFLAGNCWC